MAETQLITISDVRAYRALSENVDGDKFDAYVTEIQRNYLRNLLGDSMYYDFWSKYPDGGVCDDLVNGKSYDYGGETIQYYGLKPYLSYLFLVAYITDWKVFLTDYGSAEFSGNPQDYLSALQPSGTKEQKAYYYQQAEVYRCDAIKFINYNSTDYPLYQRKPQPPDPRGRIRKKTIR